MRNARAFLAFIGLVLAVPAIGMPATQDSTSPPATIYKLADKGVIAPVAIKQVRPRYPPSGSQGESYRVVLVDAVVLADGTVGDVTVRKSAGDAAYDDAAVKAAKQWTFKPGKREGRAVAVRVPLEMTYTRK
jgi:TonB family protein